MLQSSSHSSDQEGPFPGVDEDTVEYIRQLLREKDEARENYSQGTTVAIVTAQFQTGHDLLQVEPVRLPLGSEDWWIFEELTDDMEMAAAAISEDVSIEAVIGNVFTDD